MRRTVGTLSAIVAVLLVGTGMSRALHVAAFHPAHESSESSHTCSHAHHAGHNHAHDEDDDAPPRPHDDHEDCATCHLLGGLATLIDALPPCGNVRPVVLANLAAGTPPSTAGTGPHAPHTVLPPADASPVAHRYRTQG